MFARLLLVPDALRFRVWSYYTENKLERLPGAHWHLMQLQDATGSLSIVHAIINATAAVTSNEYKRMSSTACKNNWCSKSKSIVHAITNAAAAVTSNEYQRMSSTACKNSWCSNPNQGYPTNQKFRIAICSHAGESRMPLALLWTLWIMSTILKGRVACEGDHSSQKNLFGSNTTVVRGVAKQA